MKGLSEMSLGELEREIAAAMAYWDMTRANRATWFYHLHWAVVAGHRLRYPGLPVLLEYSWYSSP
jgi:hypothetical protein